MKTHLKEEKNERKYGKKERETNKKKDKQLMK